VKSALLFLLLVLISSTMNAQDKPTTSTPVIPTFIKAKCDGKLSSVFLSSFKDNLTASQGYKILERLDDQPINSKALFVELSCVERNSVVAVASAYGLAKCVGPNMCHMALDGGSLNVLLCDSNGEAQCGVELFKALVNYAHTAKPILNVD
jgi:hypothetical protein